MNSSVVFIDNFDSFSYNLVDELHVLDKKVLVYRNDVEVDFIKAVLDQEQQAGHKPLLVLSPGPSTPQQSNNLIPIIKMALGKYPMLGICLGHQALGEVLGGKVVRAPVIVHGKSSMIKHTNTHCFEGLPNPLKVARYHSLIVEDLPQNVEVLAYYDKMCMSLYEPQLKLLGLQFHPESIMTTFGRQLMKKALDLLTHDCAPFEDKTQKYIC